MLLREFCLMSSLDTHTYTGTHTHTQFHHCGWSHFYTPLTAHHIHSSVSLSLFLQMYIALLCFARSLARLFQRPSSLVCPSSIHPSLLPPLSFFLPLSLLSPLALHVCVCPPRTFALHNYFSAFTSSRFATAVMI